MEAAADVSKDKNRVILNKTPPWVPESPRKAAVVHFRLMTVHDCLWRCAAVFWFFGEGVKERETVPVYGPEGGKGVLWKVVATPREQGVPLGPSGGHSIVRAWQRRLTSNGLVAVVGSWKWTLSLVLK
ncbi:hypothetical protein TNCV_3037421 [Trichonephila clavipes]|nr:hypothetical protein TNCV_3037421 [Trichonephila clavipes]